MRGVEDTLVQNVIEELPAHTKFQCQRVSHKMISPKWPRLKLTEENCLNTSEALVANHAFIAKESVGIDLAAHFCPPVKSNVLVMAFGETGEIAFSHDCHPRFGYIASLNGPVGSRPCTSLSLIQGLHPARALLRRLLKRF
ncbi:hypothetical protein EMEDMD4_1270009 [Sinorhizobium medicae]|uniref:Uncharacterized protein n=1 Tax=Sinorhizobium medicae TaxID=110321 RepID=A0A508WR56_9HYPH|nr:hypothetical protein EMEDMD4_1270009 [Sinorhizobium medicae]